MIQSENLSKFGDSGRLFHLLNKQVDTPFGRGTLEQVLGKRCMVSFPKPKGKMEFVLAEHIREVK